MRNILTKSMTGAMIVGAALSVAACSKTDNSANTADTNMTDMNTMDSSAGMTNDASATDMSGNMATDNAMMGGNDMMTGNASNAM